MALKNPFRKARKFINPVRYQYMLVGSDLVLAGIVTNKAGDTMIVREIGGTPISVPDPAERLWITKRAVTSAHARAKVETALDQVPYVLIQHHLDSLAGFRSTANHILHMFPRAEREDKAVLAFVDAQIDALNKTYEVAVAA